ncbi:hypothetical protein CDL12_18772 [Handroanthus impetiginosus]|uniref:Uncharacterized protein n=1 Tax=Handroanthus impetiginosus TaxID=429701 RepID=A0A2G9GTM7_9LAMI|nr:hypothetical protein CDL12_18772 [Handroanthus impetiginosus]
MAMPQEKPSAFTTPYSPIPEVIDNDDDYTEAAAGGGCGCFRRFCFGWPRNESHNSLSHKESWIVVKLKKLKEVSELAAGPKWKNLIRKIGKFRNPGKYNKQTTQFQYSPGSYALNFAGDDEDPEEDDTLLHSFSSRFAAHALINDQQRKTGL